MERDELGLDSAPRAVAVVGLGAILPDAPDVASFWQNVQTGRNSIAEVPADRWSIADHYHPDPTALDKTYCKIGAFVRDFQFDSTRFRIPPRVAAAMDVVQQWMLVCARAALADAGHPEGKIDPERTGVILGNALGGEMHQRTTMRMFLPEVLHALDQVPEFAGLPPAARAALSTHLLAEMQKLLPPITEDSMPGELGNVIAGRVTNALDLKGMNFTTDAACASSLAALEAAMAALVEGRVDTVITGGVDRTMGPATFVKFAKIGALSPDGSRPFDAKANGFIMGEGCVAIVLRRLADAERDGSRIYAVIRSVGGSSDGKGKGITAPNPTGQTLAMQRAYQLAGLSPKGVGLIEAHGTSTKVGDGIEAECLVKLYEGLGMPPRSVALGSVKSQIGHLKSGAGAAGLLKAILALHHKVLPPTINVHDLNPALASDRIPLFVNQQAQPWERPAQGIRRAGVSSFGFGGTNFHVVLEEHVPGVLTQGRKTQVSVSTPVKPTPPRGVVCLGAAQVTALRERLGKVIEEAKQGRALEPAAPRDEDLGAAERLVIDYGNAAELVDKGEKAFGALGGDARAWKLLRTRGVFYQAGPAPKVAFLFPGQGSQYLGMLRKMRESVPEVRDTFAEADEVMSKQLPRRLTDYIFDEGDQAAADLALRDTQICQPAVLAVDTALLRLLARFGMRPDMVMGHSLGEYAALIAAGAMPFADALIAVSARAREMSSVSIADNGRMASVFAPEATVRKVLEEMDGYVVAANLNSRGQTVIGGATKAMEKAVARFEKLGMKAVFLPVSHAFHTEIVAPASKPLRNVLARLSLTAPKTTIISNVTGEPYPSGANVREEMLDLLARQIYSPVQFVHGLETLYRLGARVFVEIGPRKVLASFVEDVLGDKGDVLALCTNQPKKGEIESFSEALCGLYAAGFGRGTQMSVTTTEESMPMTKTVSNDAAGVSLPATGEEAGHLALGRMFASFLQDGMRAYQQHFGQLPSASVAPAAAPMVARPVATSTPGGSIVVSGASLGLPGRAHGVFDDANVDRILSGETLIDSISRDTQHRMVDKHVVRLNKGRDGSANFETISNTREVLHLAGQRGAFDIVEEFGVAKERVEAFDITTQLAVASALLALRDAGIPLVRRYRQTSKGSWLPEGWVLPESLADETGVIFASAFPGYNALVDEVSRYHADKARRALVAELGALREGHTKKALPELEQRIAELEAEIKRAAYQFDRKFIFRILSMGHSQLAELIGARGPNTQVNAACASAAQALGVAEDWIRAGRCRRVIVVSADDVTSEQMLEWTGTAFLAVGAATTESDVTRAALPFDRRRHGLIIGMGASGLIVESEDAVRERGMHGIAELLGVEVSNSAFHGSRLDVDHIGQVMERLVARVERERGLRRTEMAGETVFVSHETYTPARGGSAAAEINSLRRVFGDRASQLVIANTKGMTGHPMGAGIEEAVAVKILETGKVPPVPNLREPDPDLGDLRLSKGGQYPVRYSLRLAAGFGSQVVISLMKKIGGERVANAQAYQHWLDEQSGLPGAKAEVGNKTLRIRDDGPPQKAPAKSTWAPGMGPTAWVEAPGVRPTSEPAKPVITATLAPTASVAVTHETPRATAAPAAPAPAAAGVDPVAEQLLGLVAAKTGYPRDMLALDLDLEADLGVDTVKQAEVFTEILQAFKLPRRDDLKLRDYPTLGHLIKFVREMRPDLPAASAPTSAPARIVAPAPAVSAATATAAPATPVTSATPAAQATTPAPAAGGADPVAEKLLELVAAKTGYPRDMLALDLDLEADLGIDTVKQAEIFTELRTTFEMPRRDDLKLRDYPTLGHLINLVREMRPDLPGASASAPTAASATPAAAQPVAAPSASGTDPVAERLLEMVATKTGYPRDMLAFDLDLEADLGIDTVKQAEIFTELRTAFDLPRNDELKLRDYPTLGHLVRLVHELKAQGAPAAAPAGTVATRADAKPTTASPSVIRRVPIPVLRPSLELCKPTGAALKSGARVVVVPDAGGVAKALSAKLKERGVKVLALEKGPVEAQAKAWLAEGAVDGVYHLAALDIEPDLVRADDSAVRAIFDVRVRRLFELARALLPGLGQKGAFLVAGTRLGGLHGYGQEPATAPAGGAVSGFVKAFSRESPEATVKVVDFAASAEAATVASTLVSETERDSGAVEVGHAFGTRHAIGFVATEAPAAKDEFALNTKSVFLVTGAAGGITAAITRDLATASRGTFWLLDVAPAPDPANPDLKKLGDRDALRREIFERMKAGGGRVTPAQVEKVLSDLDRDTAILNVIRGVEQAGAKVNYRAVDVRDANAMAAIVGEIKKAHGRIDAVLHAAGLERSRALADKPQEEFDRVFEVKVLGLCNLLRAAEGMPIGALIGFSSVAGRFGNAGQTDYSAANDFLCKMCSALPRWWPEIRALAIDWTAWGDVGMATRGSLPEVMKRAGIDMLPLAEGLPIVRQELVGGGRGEIVIGKNLGILVQPRDAEGGLDVKAVNARLDTEKQPMLGRVLGLDLYEGLRIETVLDPEVEPFLRDHAIDGIPVLPGVMGIEGFAEVARLLLGDHRVAGLDGVRFEAPLKYYKRQPRSGVFRALLRRAGPDEVLADLTLSSTRALASGEQNESRHFVGTVRLSRKASEPQVSREVAEVARALRQVSSHDIYRIYFHGPSYQVLDKVEVTSLGVRSRMRAGLPPALGTANAATLIAPRLIELCLQTAGVYEIGKTGRLALPAAIDRLTSYGTPSESSALHAEIRPRGDAEGLCFDAKVCDGEGRVYLELAGYRTAALPAGLPDELVEPLRAAVVGEA